MKILSVYTYLEFFLLPSFLFLSGDFLIFTYWKHILFNFIVERCNSCLISSTARCSIWNSLAMDFVDFLFFWECVPFPWFVMCWVVYYILAITNVKLWTLWILLFFLMIIISFVKAGNYLVCAWTASSVSGWQSPLSSDILSLSALFIGLPYVSVSLSVMPHLSLRLLIYLHFSFCSSEWIMSIDNFNFINPFFYQFKSCSWGPDVKFSFVVILFNSWISL